MESTSTVQITHPHTCIRVGDTQLTIRPERDGAIDPCVAVEAEQLLPGGDAASVWLTTGQARDLTAILAAAEHNTTTLTDHVGDDITVTHTNDQLEVVLVRADDDIQESVSVYVTLPAAYLTDVRAALNAATDQAELEARISEQRTSA
ncbi:hypothetical protein [Streptomyces sp. NPDC054771]